MIAWYYSGAGSIPVSALIFLSIFLFGLLEVSKFKLKPSTQIQKIFWTTAWIWISKTLEPKIRIKKVSLYQDRTFALGGTKLTYWHLRHSAAGKSDGISLLNFYIQEKGSSKNSRSTNWSRNITIWIWRIEKRSRRSSRAFIWPTTQNRNWFWLRTQGRPSGEASSA